MENVDKVQMLSDPEMRVKEIGDHTLTFVSRKGDPILAITAVGPDGKVKGHQLKIWEPTTVEQKDALRG